MSADARPTFDVQQWIIASRRRALGAARLRRPLFAAGAEGGGGRHLERQRAAHRHRDHPGAQAREQEPHQRSLQVAAPETRRAQGAANGCPPLASGREDAPQAAIPTTKVPDASVAPTADTAAPSSQLLCGGAPRCGRFVDRLVGAGVGAGIRQRDGSRPAGRPARRLHRFVPLTSSPPGLPRASAIRGKVPFDTLKKLHASAVVTVTSGRKVGSFSIVKPSGNATFDAEVQATLAHIQSGGTELPAPPPMYPDMLEANRRPGRVSMQRSGSVCE